MFLEIEDYLKHHLLPSQASPHPTIQESSRSETTISGGQCGAWAVLSINHALTHPSLMPPPVAMKPTAFLVTMVCVCVLYSQTSERSVGRY